MVLIIDNYDSFSYNLYQLIGTINPDIKIIRNDECTVEEIEKLGASHIVISPGPGKPSDAGRCEEVIEYFAGKTPILGVCLGHQAICETFGSTIGYAKELMHGKSSIVSIDTSSKLFCGMDENIKVARYHSLSVDDTTMPGELKVIGRADDGEVMAVEYDGKQVFGVQFHPESILTPNGLEILKNFLAI